MCVCVLCVRAYIIRTYNIHTGAASPLNYRLALWTDLAVGANEPPIH